MEEDKKIKKDSTNRAEENINEPISAQSSDEAMEELKNKAEEYLNGWKRERADFLNYKKDEMERIGNLIKYANEEIILNLLPVLDNVSLAEVHLKDEGISQIKKQFLDLLKKEGVEPIKTIGGKFDPNTMEAVGEAEGAERSRSTVESDIVVEEVQSGYKLNGKIIRVAKVKVTK